MGLPIVAYGQMRDDRVFSYSLRPERLVATKAGWGVPCLDRPHLYQRQCSLSH